MSIINFGLQCKAKHGLIVGDLHYISTIREMNPHLEVKVITSTPTIYYGEETISCSGLCELYKILKEETKPETLFIIDELPKGLGNDACKDIEEAILTSKAQCLIFFSSVEDLDTFPISLDFTCFIEENKESNNVNILYFEEDLAHCVTV